MADGLVDETTCNLFPNTGEWEREAWQGAAASAGQAFAPYMIRRRPAPSANAKEIALPSNVVIDLTTVLTTKERSRVPMDRFSGSVDLMVYPDSRVVPTVAYSSPSSVGMSAAFLHLWLAERADVFAPAANAINPNAAPTLPIDVAAAPNPVNPQGPPLSIFGGARVAGEYRIVTVFCRTGRVVATTNPPFDAAGNIAGGNFNVGAPFIGAQQGITQ